MGRPFDLTVAPWLISFALCLLVALCSGEFKPDVPQTIGSANACPQVLMPFAVDDLKHRGTEITELVPKGITVFSVPPCFVLLAREHLSFASRLKVQTRCSTDDRQF